MGCVPRRAWVTLPEALRCKCCGDALEYVVQSPAVRCGRGGRSDTTDSCRHFSASASQDGRAKVSTRDFPGHAQMRQARVDADHQIHAFAHGGRVVEIQRVLVERGDQRTSIEGLAVAGPDRLLQAEELILPRQVRQASRPGGRCGVDRSYCSDCRSIPARCAGGCGNRAWTASVRFLPDRPQYTSSTREWSRASS